MNDPYSAFKLPYESECFCTKYNFLGLVELPLLYYTLAMGSVNGHRHYLNNRLGYWPISLYSVQAKAHWPAPRTVNPNSLVQYSRVISGAVWPPPHHLSSLAIKGDSDYSSSPTSFQSIASAIQSAAIDSAEMVPGSTSDSDSENSSALFHTFEEESAQENEGSQTLPIHVDDNERNLAEELEPLSISVTS
ncbi:hypothetical protein J3R30DRAFT_3524945 [Lentinula aciculospora]|uniref:Uncharacterized protein n=1 Tax=Lentinula aciculospora TaxID=153920 RepID=A0A9W9A0B7_9AGAR|nr:hypothetical protein J3R30DRAFT_3524945 [Lentinula aciculospora]